MHKTAKVLLLIIKAIKCVYSQHNELPACRIECRIECRIKGIDYFSWNIWTFFEIVQIVIINNTIRQAKMDQGSTLLGVPRFILLETIFVIQWNLVLWCTLLLGLHKLCRHNFEHNGLAKASSIMPT